MHKDLYFLFIFFESRSCCFLGLFTSVGHSITDDRRWDCAFLICLAGTHFPETHKHFAASERFSVVVQPRCNLARAATEEKSLRTCSHLTSSLDRSSSPVSAGGKRVILVIAKLPAAMY